jgi:hypothetical protein
MTSDDTDERKRRHVDRERVLRTLTFWLRPEFLLRVINRGSAYPVRSIRVVS